MSEQAGRTSSPGEHGASAVGDLPLSALLHDWRSGRRLSLTDAGRILGVHPTTYQRWEQGTRPYTRSLSAIAARIGLELAVVDAAAGPPPQRPGRPPAPDASALTLARLAAGLNRAELGRRLHVGAATVYQWERGRRRPPDEFLRPLARELHLRAEQLRVVLENHPPCRHHGAVLPSLGIALRALGCSRSRAREVLLVGSSTIFEWETGKVRTPAWALQRLAGECGVPVEELGASGAAPRPPRPRAPLAQLRGTAHMTVREAAAVLGISQASLHRYEAGIRTMSPALCLRMASLYRVPAGRVLLQSGRPTIQPPPGPWTPTQLPEILRYLRTRSGQTLADVARMTGVSHPTVRRWEDGRSTPSRSALATIELHHRMAAGRLVSLTQERGLEMPALGAVAS